MTGLDPGRTPSTQEVIVARLMHTAQAGGHRPTPIADLDHILATATIALGAVGLLLVAIDLPAAGVVLGVVGMVVALAAQMFSRTRAERFVDMAGLLACFLAVAIGASQGGLG